MFLPCSHICFEQDAQGQGDSGSSGAIPGVCLQNARQAELVFSQHVKKEGGQREKNSSRRKSTKKKKTVGLLDLELGPYGAF